ncbi:MAG: ABC transporter ATP-binding protein [Acidobacteria bacterium]|nr:MAG: ABC transporter ATP-binding protein [Acidobacteriota bacterium]
MDAHLELTDVSKRFARTVAVDRLSLSVPRGAIYGLLGPNGAGKTTTIRMVMRITLPDSGEIRLGGRLIDDDLREAIGYLPEERGLYRRMKVLDQLAYLGEVRGLARPDARRRAGEWLEKLGLAAKADARVEELSKGMQQKVQFAGAVIHGPEFVILDEPFTGLDPIATRQLKDELLAMAAAGTTVLLSTHVLPQAEELADHICLINRGRPILQGALEEVRGRFVTPALKVVSPAADAELAAAPGVAAVRQGDGGRIVELAAGAAAPAVIRALAAAVPLEAVAPLAETLEDIFLRAVEADHAAVA